MKLYYLFALSFVFFIIGCGSGVPSGNPDESSDESLIESAFDYEIKLVQRFFIPKMEKGIKNYLDFLKDVKDLYGGSAKVEISDKIENIEKLQVALPEFKKCWKDASCEIIERAEASERDVKNYIETKLLEIYRVEMIAFEDELDKLEKNENAKEVETTLMGKIADLFVPKVNTMLKELGFKEDLFKKEDVEGKYYSPKLPEMQKLPYEVLSNFRNIKTHIKYPVLKMRNDEYITDLSTKYNTSLLIRVSEDWFLSKFSFEDVYSRYFSGNTSGLMNEAMMFFENDFEKNINSPEDASKSAGSLYFVGNIVRSDYNVNLKDEYFEIQDELSKWVYMYNSKRWESMADENKFIKANLSSLEECEIEVKHTELKKINADIDLSLKYMNVVENENTKDDDEKTAEKDKKNDETKKEKKRIISESGKYRIEEKTIYLRVFLNYIGEKWRIIRTEKINEPRKAEPKTE